MLMDEGLDTGPVLATLSVQIDESTTTIKLHDQLATLGGPLLVDTLKKLHSGSITPERQPDEGITYAHKISTQNACIDWCQDRETVMRQIHAFNPAPGAYTFAGHERMKIFLVSEAQGKHARLEPFGKSKIKSSSALKQVIFRSSNASFPVASDYFKNIWRPIKQLLGIRRRC